MKFTLTNPTLPEIQAAVREANAAANPPRARERLVSLSLGVARRALAEPTGVIQHDGGGVANSYGYAAGVSVVGIAWHLDGATRRVVVAGERSATVGRHVTPIFGARATGWSVCQAQVDRETCAARLEALGERGQDDRVSLRQSYLLADAGAEGVLIGDRPTSPRAVQCVVRDGGTGLRHHLAVPPRFGRHTPGATDADRVRAAVAWTFRLSPSQYAPAIEA